MSEKRERENEEEKPAEGERKRATTLAQGDASNQGRERAPLDEGGAPSPVETSSQLNVAPAPLASPGPPARATVGFVHSVNDATNTVTLALHGAHFPTLTIRVALNESWEVVKEALGRQAALNLVEQAFRKYAAAQNATLAEPFWKQILCVLRLDGRVDRDRDETSGDTVLVVYGGAVPTTDMSQ